MERQDKRSLISLAQAQQAAKALCEHPDIKSVVVFGSVARDNEGEDLDIILVCNEVIAEEFVYYVKSVLDEEEADPYTSAKHIRRNIALTSFSCEELDSILNKVERFVSIYDMDIFIFPPDWRNRLDELQNALPHSDPHFMHNIARDARVLWVK